jgi:hypothetical protein
MKGFFQNNKINWKESQMHGVIRRLKSSTGTSDGGGNVPNLKLLTYRI